MKTGRNDPCPCGSGKKFKKCCAGVAVAAVPEAEPAVEAAAEAVAAEPAVRTGRKREPTWEPLHKQVGALWPSRMSRKKPK